MGLTRVVFPANMNCVTIMRVAAVVGMRKRKTKYDLKPATSISEAHAANKTVTSFYAVHSISTHNKESVLNLELALLHLHMMFQPTEHSVAEFLPFLPPKSMHALT
jgi:hypothetical protein